MQVAVRSLSRAVLWTKLAASVLLAGLLLSNFAASAQGDTNYGNEGWWLIKYRQLEDMDGCEATARFQDQTMIQMALVRMDANQSWMIFISHPSWTWIKKGKTYRLRIVTTKGWVGTFYGSEYVANQLSTDNLSVEFMNSIADASSLTIMDQTNRLLTRRPLDMKDSAAAIRAVVNCVRDHSVPGPGAKKQASEITISGTGFFVAPNLILTNNHLVRDCKSPIQVRYPERASRTATISGQDNTNDLALLQTDVRGLSVASFHFQQRLGEMVATYGFPYSGVLSSSGNFTLGNITSLSGMRDDTRFLQISSPIQPGNSGGPLLNMSGSVIGVVVAQLRAVKMMQADQSVPQNVNFAIQAPIVSNFLSAKGVNSTLDTSQDHLLPPSDVADIAKKFTVQIYCQGVSSNLARSSDTRDAAHVVSTFGASVTPLETGDLSARLTSMKAHRLLNSHWRELNRATDTGR